MEGLGAKEEKGERGAQMSPSAQGESPGMGSGGSPLGIYLLGTSCVPGLGVEARHRDQ